MEIVDRPPLTIRCRIKPTLRLKINRISVSKSKQETETSITSVILALRCPLMQSTPAVFNYGRVSFFFIYFFKKSKEQHSDLQLSLYTSGFFTYDWTLTKCEKVIGKEFFHKDLYHTLSLNLKWILRAKIEC